MAKSRNLMMVEDEDSDVFGPCHEHLDSEQKEQILNYKWDAPDADGLICKIYPSAITSYKICPKEFIEEKVHTRTYFHMNALEAMEAGKIMHDMYETVMARIPGFIQSPDLSYYKEVHPEYYDMVVRKCKTAFPEAYCYDPESGTSLKVDVPKTNGVLIDLKSLACPPSQFIDGKWKHTCWTEEKAKLAQGKDDHRAQLEIYNYFTTYKYKYWNLPYGRNAYFNTTMKKGNDEYYEPPKFEFTEKGRLKVANLFKSLIAHRNAWLENTTIACEYSLCPKHGGVKVV